MQKSWTIKILESLSDEDVLQRLAAERMSGLNPYGPLATRLKKVYDRLERGAKLLAK